MKNSRLEFSDFLHQVKATKGELNSQRGKRGSKFSEGTRFLRASHHVFLQTCYYCGSIVINYSCHYVYSNIFDIAEFLTQNDHGPI